MKGEYGNGGISKSDSCSSDSSNNYDFVWWEILTNGNNFDTILCKEIRLWGYGVHVNFIVRKISVMESWMSFYMTPRTLLRVGNT